MKYCISYRESIAIYLKKVYHDSSINFKSLNTNRITPKKISITLFSALTFFVKSDDEISESIVEMEKERISLKESKKEKTSVITLLKDRSIRLPLLITVVVPCAVQFSGIAGVS